MIADRSSAGEIRLVLSGDWVMAEKPPAFDTVDPGAAASGARKMILAGEDMGRWDSSLLVFVGNAVRSADDRGIELDIEGLPSGVRRLIALATAVPEREGARRGESRRPLVHRIGESVIAAVTDVGESVRFLGEVTIAFFRMLGGRARFRKRDLGVFIQDCGVSALPIITVIQILVGVVLAFLGAIQLKLFGAQIFVADLVGIGVVREMGALMTGIIMAGRTGAAFAAQLGTMQVNEEVDALKTMGFSPIEFLVLPRMLALILMMPLLVIYADFLGIIGGAIIGIVSLDLTPVQYYMQTKGAITMEAIAAGLIKGVVFGVIVAISGCMKGIRSGRSASAVGDAATDAVVAGILYIIIWDSLLTLIYTVVGL